MMPMYCVWWCLHKLTFTCSVCFLSSFLLSWFAQGPVQNCFVFYATILGWRGCHFSMAPKIRPLPKKLNACGLCLFGSLSLGCPTLSSSTLSYSTLSYLLALLLLSEFDARIEGSASCFFFSSFTAALRAWDCARVSLSSFEAVSVMPSFLQLPFGAASTASGDRSVKRHLCSVNIATNLLSLTLRPLFRSAARAACSQGFCAFASQYVRKKQADRLSPVCLASGRWHTLSATKKPKNCGLVERKTVFWHR